MISKDKKENEKIFCIVAFFLMITSLVLSFMNYKFVSAFMLLLALFLFSICYLIRDNKKLRFLIYILFIVGVILVMGSLVYTFMRIL